jgi:2-polyprenyl-3-methyl-5-hydroxy-6-metoxy-1,4-benzoquinol methylase
MTDQSIIHVDICPLCNNQGSKRLFSTVYNRSTFDIRQCNKCNLAWTVSLDCNACTDIYDNKQYYGSGKNKFIPFLQNIRSRLSRMRAKKILSLLPKSIRRPRILDIGCAEGRLLQSFLKYGCDCYGIEHKSYPRERFLDSNRITYFSEDMDSIELEQGLFNIIILWHVLEHMDNPDSVIKHIYDLLAPEGIVLIAVPNFSCVEASIFKDNWFHLDLPWHRYHFTEKSLQYLFLENSLEILTSTTFCIEQGPYGLLQSLLNRAGVKKNSLYEVIKGNYTCCSSISLVTQFLMVIILLLPCFLTSFLISMTEKGSSFKLVLKKSLSTYCNGQDNGT